MVVMKRQKVKSKRPKVKTYFWPVNQRRKVKTYFAPVYLAEKGKASFAFFGRKGDETPVWPGRVFRCSYPAGRQASLAFQRKNSRPKVGFYFWTFH
ncbi:MAG: hypothetical protein LBS49_14950 [Candidatus Accumulibacter sp.]|jgi:hypothetical protein|nr:hypothetical protein [Accumulibacter sp.]